MNPKTIIFAIAIAIFILFCIPGESAENYSLRDARTGGKALEQFVYPTVFSGISSAGSDVRGIRRYL